MFKQLEQINAKPRVFGQYTAKALWADEHRAERMLAFHLNEGLDVSSRNAEFIDISSAWIIDYFGLASAKSVCDFGCGPGLYTTRFANTGAAVTGVDFSENSIRYARAQAELAKQTINYVHANYLEFQPTRRFDLITMIMCDYCALSPDQRMTLLHNIRDALDQGGAFLLDVYSMAAYADRQETSSYERNQLDHFWCKEEYYCFVNTFKYDEDAVVLDKYSVFPESGGAETVYNWLQYFSLESLTHELSTAGFAVEHAYQDICGQPFSEQHPEFAVIARKD